MTTPLLAIDRDELVSRELERINDLAASADVASLNLGPLARMDTAEAVRRLFEKLSEISVAQGGEPVPWPGPFYDVDAALTRLSGITVVDAEEGGGGDEFVLQLGGQTLQLGGQDLTLGA